MPFLRQYETWESGLAGALHLWLKLRIGQMERFHGYPRKT